jgi:hypothetical protein
MMMLTEVVDGRAVTRVITDPGEEARVIDALERGLPLPPAVQS